MAGEQQQANNETTRTQPAGEGEQQRQQQPHSRVGGRGIPEAPGNSADKAATSEQSQESSTPSSSSSLVQPSRSSGVLDGLCRYASGGMSFVEVCQVGTERRKRRAFFVYTSGGRERALVFLLELRFLGGREVGDRRREGLGICVCSGEIVYRVFFFSLIDIR